LVLLNKVIRKKQAKNWILFILFSGLTKNLYFISGLVINLLTIFFGNVFHPSEISINTHNKRLRISKNIFIQYFLTMLTFGSTK